MSKPKRQIVFYPLFRVRLIQMIRHGEVHQAIALAGRELRLALEDGAHEDGGEDGDGGIVMVPSPSRAKEFGYHDPLIDPNEPKGIRP